MYVTLEGIDTCGKSTQIKLLKEKFPDSILTKEPGGTALGHELRDILLHGNVKSKRAELLLFVADRAEHFKEVIENNSDKLVFSDRGVISGIAYGMNDFEDLDMLIALNNFALKNQFPDKVILIKTNQKLLKERMSIKKADNIEKRGFDYLLSIQSNMIKVLEYMDIDHLILDASDSIDSLHLQILEFLD